MADHKNDHDETEGPVMPRELHEHLSKVYDRLGRIEKALILLAVIAGPKFVLGALDAFTAAAQAFTR